MHPDRHWSIALAWPHPQPRPWVVQEHPNTPIRAEEQKVAILLTTTTINKTCDKNVWVCKLLNMNTQYADMPWVQFKYTSMETEGEHAEMNCEIFEES